jgi:ADP-glucose pyrophosphorylase
VTNSLIARGCVLQGGHIERSILAPGVHIDAGAEVVESILFDGVRIGRGARVHRAIIDRDIVVPPTPSNFKGGMVVKRLGWGVSSARISTKKG